jgi:hypothetical protein
VNYANRWRLFIRGGNLAGMAFAYIPDLPSRSATGLPGYRLHDPGERMYTAAGGVTCLALGFVLGGLRTIS